MVDANSKCDAVVCGERARKAKRRLPPTAKAAFTLVELLVVITILAILASMVLFALAGATESAKDMKTRATLNKLHTIVMQKYDTYRTRRVPITIPNNYTPLEAATLRLHALRELMRAEIPDSFKDINDAAHANPKYLAKWPSVRNAYKRKMDAAQLAPAYMQAGEPHQESAACLYWFITVGSGDPDVLEQFAPNEIGSGDDGLRYFVDGWGRPIRFLRWAPAFVSPLQPNAGTQKDPFDPMNVSANFAPAQVTYPLYPLIFSAGPDGHFDVGEKPPGTFDFTTVDNSPYHASVKPHLGNTTQDTDLDGSIDNVDNITNHDLGGS